MSSAVRRLQRRGQPVVGERLEGVQAHYRNAKGHAFMVEVDSRTGFDMQQLYRHLTEIVAETIDVAAAFAQLDALANDSRRGKRRQPLERAIHALLDIHWLEHHGHLISDEHNGMVFCFSRPNSTESGKRVGFFRQTPTPGQETAFARTIKEAGEIVKVVENE